MRNSVFIPIFIITIITICCVCIVPINGQCLEDQRSLLLQLKNEFDSLLSTKLVQWNHHNKDCCLWEGITCSKAGHVTGLDLNDKSIFGGIDNSSSLFGLRFLQSLNLSDNYFYDAQIPPTFINLTSLTCLNLSNSGFRGQIPIELSQLTRLVTLDLSGVFPEFFYLKLENPNLNMFVQNLTQLTELYLDGVEISAQGHDWGQPISSWLPNLRVLSLSYCSLSGPIDSSLLKLQFLSVIRLDHNNLNAPVPEFLVNFKNLTSLYLRFCSLKGALPENIFHLQTLQILELYDNTELNGSLPEFPQNGNLQTLVISNTKVSGQLPNSIGNLGMLSKMDLSNSNFTGQIPKSMGKFTQLAYLDFSSNMFTGAVPSLQMSKYLTHIGLSYNNLSGQFSFTQFEDNQIGGEIPNWIWKVGNGSLRYLNLSLNFLENHQEPYVIPSLIYLDLHSNHLRGKLPLPPDTAEHVDYSSNYFSSSIPVDIGNNIFFTLFFSVANNNLIGTIPISICNTSFLNVLDMSNNSLSGPIPLCLIEWSDSTLQVLNLGKNRLSGNLSGTFQKSCGLKYLDLRANQLEGKVPESISNCTSLEVLNLGNNKINDTFP
ncbi:hypothetical protein LguiA_026026 [Lonicera macranthoides]